MTEPRSQAPDARFTLANERTLLAYQRSAIGLMAAAIAVAHFFGDDTDVLVLALALLGTGAFAGVGGYLRYRQVDAALRQGRTDLERLRGSHRQPGRAALPALRGLLRRHAGRLSVPASALVLCVDVGSTFTKAALVDGETGELLATTDHRTTIPDRRHG